MKLVSGAVSRTIPIGTHGYAPIEQARGKPRFSSDIYAVGMTAIQSLTGIDNPSKLPEDNNGEVVWRNGIPISDWLADILTKMVRYDFHQRYVDIKGEHPTLADIPEQARYRSSQRRDRKQGKFCLHKQSPRFFSRAGSRRL